MDFWTEMAGPGPEVVTVNDVPVRRGSRVRLRPHTRADAMDAILAGRTAVVEGIDEDDVGGLRLAVTVEDDPGRDLGDARQPGHRFFFAPDEVEPLEAVRRVLVAGIGNVFLGDDGFGVAVAQRLAGRPLPPGVLVADFGIRGLDLAYALQDYDAAILVDAAPRGGVAGTLYVIEPVLHPMDGAQGEPPVDGHAMDPVRVLGLARRLGRMPARTIVVGCEPATLGGDDVLGELSEPVAAAVDRAAALVASLVREMTREMTRSLTSLVQEMTLEGGVP